MSWIQKLCEVYDAIITENESPLAYMAWSHSHECVD